MHASEDEANKSLFLRREKIRNSKTKSKTKPAFVSTVGKVKEFGYLRPSLTTPTSSLNAMTNPLMSAEKRLDELLRLSDSNDLFSDDNDNDSEDGDIRNEDLEQDKSITTVTTAPIVESPHGFTTIPFSRIPEYQNRRRAPIPSQKRSVSPDSSKKTLPATASNPVVETSQHVEQPSPSPIPTATSVNSRVAVTVRWIQLSRTLFQLLTSSPLGARFGRVEVSLDAMKQILQVLRWRVFSVISESEFSALYKEYRARIDSALVMERVAIKKKVSNKKSTTKIEGKAKKHEKSDLPPFQCALLLGRFRELLLNEAFIEPDLDLFVGLLLHEYNTLLIDQPISYRMKPNQLDTVDGEWVTLTAELFFLLDGPGYGLLYFDEMFFFAFCLVSGRSDLGHSNKEGEDELQDWESALSLNSLRTLTWQILQECGVGEEEDEVESDGSARSASGVCLPVFQCYLLRKGQGCSGIKALIQHIRVCLARCASICLDSGRPDLAVFHSVEATYPVSNPNPSIVVPRIWQHAVLEATGVRQPNLNLRRNQFSNPAMLFLLTDAAYYLSLLSEVDPGEAEDQVRGLLAQDQIRRSADSIFAHFRDWITSDPSGRGGSPLMLSDSNPLQGLVLSTVQTYLNMQQAMSAALFDTVVAHRTLLSFGGEPLFDGEQLNLICTSIFPQTPFQPGSKSSSMSSSSVQAKPSRYDQAPSTADSVGICDDDIDSHLSYRSKVSTSSRLSSTPNPAPSQRNSTTRLSFQKHPNLSDANLRNSVSEPEQKIPTASTAPNKSAYPRIPPGSSSLSFPQVKSSNSHWATVMASNPSPNHPYSWGETALLTKSETNVNPHLSLPAPARSDTPTLVERPVPLQNQDININPTIELFPIPKLAPKSNPYQYNPPSKNGSLPGERGQEGNTVLTVSDEDVRLLQQLLLARDPVEQQSLVERLRLLKLSEQITQVSVSSSSGLVPPLSNAAVSSEFGMIQQDRHDDAGSLGLERGYESDTALGHRRVESDAASEATASSVGPPSSIMELLQQGQTAGKYAQMLREILRKMSKDDSKVRLKALEDVIQLGNSIAIAEEEAGGAFKSADHSLMSGSGSPIRAGPAKRAISSNPRKARAVPTPRNKEADTMEREYQNSHRFADLAAYPNAFTKPGDPFAQRISEENLANERLQSRHIRAQVISFDSEGSFSPSLTNNEVIIKRSVPGRIPTEKGQAGRNSKVFGHRIK